MAIRAARYIDIPAIVRLMKEAHQRSMYAESAHFDDDVAKPFLAQCIQRHGHENVGGTLVMVSETDGQVTGFIIGILDNVYPCLRELVATDLLFIMGDNAYPWDAMKMILRMERWAKRNPKVVEFRAGVTGAIEDWERTGKLYERRGMKRFGAIYRLELHL